MPDYSLICKKCGKPHGKSPTHEYQLCEDCSKQEDQLEEQVIQIIRHGSSPESIAKKVIKLIRDKRNEPSDTHLLTKRELAILRLVEAGLLNKQITVTLGIADQTVKNHLYNIFQKLDVTTRTQAVVVAMRLKLL